MYEESNSPMIDMNIVLLDPKETYIRIVRNISHRDRRHQPGKEGQCEQKARVPNICMRRNLS